MNHVKHLSVFFLFQVLVLLTSCKHSGGDKHFVLHVHLRGFSKGTAYISKLKDTVFTVADSVHVSGKDTFTLTDTLSSPQIYYFKIREIPRDSLLIFAEPGDMYLEAFLNRFAYKYSLTGSVNQDLLETYRKMIGHFRDKELEMVKAHLEMKKTGDSIGMDSLDKAYRKLLGKKYLYTANFAVQHSGKAVAPYLALTRLYDADIRLLDTVYQSLTPEIKESLYGKQLKHLTEFIHRQDNPAIPAP